MTLEWPSALTRGWVKIDPAISHVDARCDCVAVAPPPQAALGSCNPRLRWIDEMHIVTWCSFDWCTAMSTPHNFGTHSIDRATACGGDNRNCQSV